MTSPSRLPVQNSSTNRRDLMWTKSERAIASKAFDPALERELHEVIQEAKRMASQITQPSDLWDLEHYLTQRRKEIDRTYDYRYSQLDLVFGRLPRERWIDEEDLRGLREDSWKPSVLTPSSLLERTQHDLVLSAMVCYIS